MKKNKKFFNSKRIKFIREALSFPFIWFMLFPILILDICLFIYQNTAMRLYWIPLAKRSDYIVYDRESLAFMTWYEKLDCLYCSYVNWFLAYASEVAWRTEKYWCPMKHYKKNLAKHEWQPYFADYNDEKKFREVRWEVQEFFQK